MARFAVSARIDAPVERVWDVVRDWEGSSAWQVDATTVEVMGPQREGVGTRVRAVTRIALIALTDWMVVTEWTPNRLLRVRHVGWPIRGDAWFGLTPDGGGTRVEWVEDLVPPLGFIGEIAAWILRKPIEAVLRRSLAKLTALAEA